MAKKNKDEVPNPNNVTNRDILQRMNFLYQASSLLSSMNPPQPPPAAHARVYRLQRASYIRYWKSVQPNRFKLSKEEKAEKKKERRRKRHPKTCLDLSKEYTSSMKSIGQKTTTRLDPSVKRTICKKCNLILTPGVTAKVRVNPSDTHGNNVSYTCYSCKTVRCIPAPPIAEAEQQGSTDQPVAGPSDSPEEDMQVDSTESNKASTSAIPPPRKQRFARLPPLFERDVGHVVFRGNQRIGEDSQHHSK
ncbi:Rpr2-domain-containing protein [Panus rudis PR-1116 ss-1]|nr:Rpr2-domain-containing protein [Panus rudis PR-1116 ss-1]